MGLDFGLVKLRGVAPGLFRLILFVLDGWFPGSVGAKFHAGSRFLLFLIILLSLLELVLLELVAEAGLVTAVRHIENQKDFC